MRVLTLNVFSRHADWRRRRRALISGIRTLDPDIAFVQEAVVLEDYDQVHDLFGPGYEVFHQSGRAADGSGASIVSRGPLEDVDEAYLQVTPRMNAEHRWIGSVAIAEVDAPVGRLLLVHHKPSWQLGYEHERELQAVRMARLVEERLGEREVPVVLAGDFDAAPDSASVRFISGLQSLDGMSVAYRDAGAAVHGDEPGHTFSPRNPLVANGEMPLEAGRRIDYIFVRCGDHGPSLRVASCDLCLAEAVDGVWASDHFGVVADLVTAP